jgi:nucleoside-diphosphate-sugar epimerase
MTTSSQDRNVILVTGAAGFLGSNVVRTLLDRFPDSQIIATSRSESPELAVSDRISHIYGDLRESNTWETLPATITHVCHLAASIPWSESKKALADVMRDNLLPVENLARQFVRWPNLKQIIYSSSVSVYESTSELLTEDSPTQPASVYGQAKLAGEQCLGELNNKGVHTVSLRFSSIYGYGQYPKTVLPIMVARARDKQELRVFGDGKRTQDFIHRSDAARAIAVALEANARGVYNLGSGTATSMLELAQLANKVFAGGRSSILLVPDMVAKDPGIRLDITRAGSDLNYQPLIQLEAGLMFLKQEMETIGRID